MPGFTLTILVGGGLDYPNTIYIQFPHFSGEKIVPNPRKRTLKYQSSGSENGQERTLNMKNNRFNLHPKYLR